MQAYATSSGSGKYLFKNLPAGNYTLEISKKYHIYFARKNGGSSLSGAKLDVDRTGGKIKWEPETITLSQARPGEYNYSVVNYTEKHHSKSTRAKKGKFPVSRAKVEVYTDRGLVRTFYVPNSEAGNTCNVFRYNGSTGAITPVNTITK